MRDLLAILYDRPYTLPAPPKVRTVAKIDPKIYDQYVGEYTLATGAYSEGFRQRDPAGAFLYDSIRALNPPREVSAETPPVL